MWMLLLLKLVMEVVLRMVDGGEGGLEGVSEEVSGALRGEEGLWGWAWECPRFLYGMMVCRGLRRGVWGHSLDGLKTD